VPLTLEVESQEVDGGSGEQAWPAGVVWKLALPGTAVRPTSNFKEELEEKECIYGRVARSMATRPRGVKLNFVGLGCMGACGRSTIAAVVIDTHIVRVTPRS
jgi:hypothetical protein